MSKKGWRFFILTELGMILFVYVLMRWLGFYTIEVALWRKILATILMPAAMAIFVWYGAKNA